MLLLRRLAGCIIALSCLYAHATTLVFDKYIEIRNERILLGDIARIQEAGADEAALAAIDLGKAPAIGRVEKLQTTQVLKWINHRHPQFQNINTQGPSTFLIKTATRVISPDELKQKAKNILSSTFTKETQWELLTLPRPTAFIVPDRNYQLVVSSIQPTKQCERVMVKINAISGNDVLASKSLWFSKTKTSGREKTIDGVSKPEIIKSTELNHCKHSCDCVWQVENQILTPQKYRSTSDVSRFEEVMIEMRTSDFVIETTGIALANAKKGEKVQVKKIGSTDSFMATVISPGRVQVLKE